MTTKELKLKVKSSGQYLNIFQVTSEEGRYACQGNTPTTDNFVWTLIESETNRGWYLLKVKSSNQYLNVLNSATNNGAATGQNSLADVNSAPPNFLWKLTNAPKNPGWCYLQAKSSGQYLNILNSSDDNGALACQGVANTTDNFLWQINFVGESTEAHTVTVSATIQNQFPPSLSDDEGHQADTADGDKNMATLVGPGDVVTWQKGGNISSLDNVFETGGTDFFIVNPSQENNGTWVGIVGSLPSGTEEEYSITYTIQGNSYTQDPRLKMN
jgi:type II secretory pathway pseudopilin PulG